MKRKTLVTLIGGVLLASIALTGCSSNSATPAPSDSASAVSPKSSDTSASNTAATDPVLPVTSNPIVNTATEKTLEVSYAAVEDNIDPATGQAIDDRLELTLKNAGIGTLDGLEVYYEMTDVVTGQSEAYYQKLDGISIPAGSETTVYFDNLTDPGHFPENDFSIYRSSTNEVDFVIQVSAANARIATASPVKATGTGEKVD